MASSQFFSHAAQWTSKQSGRALTFGVAVGIIITWAVSGPIFHYSDTWQLVINTGTTIVTFLMVFLIQNTQNRDTSAIQLKLDELIRVSKSARNKLLALESMTDDELEQMKDAFARMANRDGGNEARIELAKADLERAAEGIEEAKDHLSPKGSQSASAASLEVHSRLGRAASRATEP